MQQNPATCHVYARQQPLATVFTGAVKPPSVVWSEATPHAESEKHTRSVSAATAAPTAEHQQTEAPADIRLSDLQSDTAAAICGIQVRVAVSEEGLYKVSQTIMMRLLSVYVGEGAIS